MSNAKGPFWIGLLFWDSTQSQSHQSLSCLVFDKKDMKHASTVQVAGLRFAWRSVLGCVSHCGLLLAGNWGRAQKSGVELWEPATCLKDAPMVNATSSTTGVWEQTL